MKTKYLTTFLGVLTSALFTLGGSQSTQAFTASDAGLAYNCWNNNFYYGLSNPNRGYYRAGDGTGTPASFWTFAEEIEIAEDAGDVNRVNLLCAGFVAQYGWDWSWNGWYDDLMWASMAFSRAYQMTGVDNYRIWAKSALDYAWAHGWDTAGGGGFWQNSSHQYKLSCVNGPGTIAAWYIYQNYGDGNYYNTARLIHAWQCANLLDSVGGVKESTVSQNVYYSYDQGTFMGAAWWVGDYNRVNPTGDFARDRWGVTMQSFGTGSDAGGFNGICLRWMGKTGYHDLNFMRAVCDNAWACRNSRGLTSVDWTQRTSDTAQLMTWDCSGVVAGMMNVPPN